MKTLTLFADHLRAIADFIQSIKADAPNDTIDILEKDIHLTCDVLVERLQEQEEELDMLRAFDKDVAGYLHVHSWDVAKWRENYKKEKTNK